MAAMLMSADHRSVVCTRESRVLQIEGARPLRNRKRPLKTAVQRDGDETGAYPVVTIALPEAIIGILTLSAEGELSPSFCRAGLALHGSRDFGDADRARW